MIKKTQIIILIIILSILGVIIYTNKLVNPNISFGAMIDHRLNVSNNPYGSWVNVQTGERKFYDIDKKFYTNTIEIIDAQKEIISLIEFTNTTTTPKI